MTNRSINLDILRSVAVFLVLGRHFTRLPVPTPQNLFVRTWVTGGWVGVDLFFVLSGFLVSGLLFREYTKFGKISFSRFLIRRGLKIYPPLYVLIAASVIIRLATHNVLDWKKVIFECLFLQNYCGRLWGQNWSLAVEEHFYLLIALTLFLVIKYRRKQNDPFSWIPMAMVLLAVVELSLRILTVATGPFTHDRNMFPTHLRLDSLMFGVLLSYLYHFRISFWENYVRRYYRLFAIVGLCVLSVAFLFKLETHVLIQTVGLTLFYVASGALIIWAVCARQAQHRLCAALAFFGANSYSVYLWHLAVSDWLMVGVQRLTHNTWNWWSYAVVYLVVSCLLGVTMSRLVEAPILAIRDRIFPSRSNPLAAGTTAPSEVGRRPGAFVPPPSASIS